ncbi:MULTISPECIES: hypothetical protein [unclassified Yoonia]|uniref:hypothetical protein n=1 Tax=unclassified Yoonia TaxID=2629118 RepID=UPI002AFFCD11|nr:MULTISPECIES: hypothetical protein [unclassified Yoonia]
MNKIFATTAFALTLAAGAVSAQTITGADEVTCAEYLAMPQLEQETMLSELVALSDGGSLQETTIADVQLLCTGNDAAPVVEVLDTSNRASSEG